MASNYDDDDLRNILSANCHTTENLLRFIALHGIDANNAAVVERQTEILANQITPADSRALVNVCCRTLEELDNFVVANGLDPEDATIQAKRHEFTVSKLSTIHTHTHTHKHNRTCSGRIHITCTERVHYVTV